MSQKAIVGGNPYIGKLNSQFIRTRFTEKTRAPFQTLDRSANDLIRKLHEFIERIKQEAPQTLGNHAIFEMLHAHPIDSLLRSPLFCMNVTRHQPGCYSIQALAE